MNERREGRKSDAPFIRKLTEYRETILLVLFFLGGGVWVFATFATKCLLEASLDAQKKVMKQQVRISDMRAKRLEIQLLENLNDHLENLRDPAEVSNRLKELEGEYMTLAEQDDDSLEKIEQAYKGCFIF